MKNKYKIKLGAQQLTEKWCAMLRDELVNAFVVFQNSSSKAIVLFATAGVL